MEGLDIHHQEHRYNLEVSRIKKLINSEIILEWLRQKKLKNKCKISTLSRELNYLRKFDQWFKKDFRKVTQKDIENVVMGLQDGKIRKENGEKYDGRGIGNNRAEIKSLFSWINKNYHSNLDLDFIDTKKKDKDIPALDMNTEVQKLVDNASNPQLKFLIRALNDGGFRIEEFLNCKWNDLFFDKELGCYMIRIRISKTKPRTISLPLSTQEINDYKDYLGKINPNDFIIKTSYAGVKKYLKQLGKRVLNKNLFPHLCRHNSCSFYANKLNHYQMCKRYGWSFNSPMPQRYIDRNGITEKETAKIIRSDEIGELKLKVNRQEIDSKIQQEKNMQKIAEQDKQIEVLFNAIKNRVKEDNEMNPKIKEEMKKSQENIQKIQETIKILQKNAKK